MKVIMQNLGIVCVCINIKRGERGGHQAKSKETVNSTPTFNMKPG